MRSEVPILPGCDFAVGLCEKELKIPVFFFYIELYFVWPAHCSTQQQPVSFAVGKIVTSTVHNHPKLQNVTLCGNSLLRFTQLG